MTYKMMTHGTILKNFQKEVENGSIIYMLMNNKTLLKISKLKSRWVKSNFYAL